MIRNEAHVGQTYTDHRSSGEHHQNRHISRLQVRYSEEGPIRESLRRKHPRAGAALGPSPVVAMGMSGGGLTRDWRRRRDEERGIGIFCLLASSLVADKAATKRPCKSKEGMHATQQPRRTIQTPARL